MATNKKITELPAATLPIATGVKFEAVQGGINVQVDADDMPGSGGGTSIPFGSTSGTNTYTIAATPAVTAYTNGMLLHVKVVNGSTNVSTFNFDSVGAKKVYLTPDTQITVGMLVSNHEYIFTYDSALDSAAGGFLLVGDYNHGLLNSRTNSFDASGGAYPSTLGSGPAGAIKHFDAFMVSVAGQMPGGGPFVKARDWLISLVDTPGNTPANWGYIISQKLYTSTGTNTDGSMDQNSVTNALAAKEATSNKDATGGYAGLTLFKINFKNALNTITSFLTNAATVARTYTFPDKDLTVVGTVDVIGTQDFFIPAAAFWPRVTAGCSPLAQTEIATSLINIQTLDFNQTTQQYAQVHYRFPKKYNLSTLTYEIEWTATTGTGSVVWGVAAVSLADGDALTTAFGTQINVTDAAGTANTERTSATSAALTISNTPAVADGIYLQVTRVTGDGSDDMAADAKFKGITIHITTNAATDA